MLDYDLAELYGVATKALNQAVKRNIERFPERYMFQLSKEDISNMRSQFATGSGGEPLLHAEFVYEFFRLCHYVSYVSLLLGIQSCFPSLILLIPTLFELRKVS